LRTLLRALLVLPVPNTIYASFAAYARPITFFSLIHPVYKELKRRMERCKSAAVLSSSISGESEQRLTSMFGRMQRLAVEAAVEVAKQTMNIKSLTCITHVPFALLKEWALVLVEEIDVAKELGVDRIGALMQYVVLSYV
jgi:hypothetical protein